MRILSLLLVLMLVFTLACAPKIIEGRKIDPTKVKQLVAGTTNANKVVELLGPPSKSETLPDGDTLYIYTYRTEDPHWWTVDDIYSQRLEVTLHKGIVKDYRFTQEEKGAILRQ